jgi:OCT family organic cation transporter-like MFS transporter 4/5
VIQYRYVFFFNLYFPDKIALKVALAMLGKFCITASYAIIYLMAAEVFPTVVR